MTSYEFTCPDCRQEMAVTEPVREATLANGCPVCGRPVADDHFTPVAGRTERADPA
ncbi:hypothetical protein HTG_15880 [Natrinema mahii]|nr:hypothetical protein HTG_15880 [Natrinema mahii]